MSEEHAEVRRLYAEGLSATQIGKRVGLSTTTVTKRLRAMGLAVSGRSTSDVWDGRKEEMEYLYHVARLSQGQIAAYFGVAYAMVQKVMDRLGIARRGKGRSGREHYNFKTGLHNRDYRKIITKDRCRLCGATTDLGIHHKNDDHYDNRLENLEVLCNPCHMSETKRKWWAAKKAGLPLPKSNGPTGWTRKPQGS